MERPWHIEMLGWLRASKADQVIATFRSRKSGILLAYLAYHPHRSHPREVLIELLWPGCVSTSGRTNLRTELTWLRQRLEPPGVPVGTVVLTEGDALRLNPARCLTDVLAFETALQSGANAPSSVERSHWLAEAVRLYQGELLPGYFEAWLLPERLRLSEAFVQAAHQLVIEREERGDLPGALRIAWRAVGVDPLREETHADLIRLLTVTGQTEAALRQHQEWRQRLELEMSGAPDLTPSPHIRTRERVLHQQLRVRTAEAAALRGELAIRTAEAEEMGQRLEIERQARRKLQRELIARTAEARERRWRLRQSHPPRRRSR